MNTAADGCPQYVELPLDVVARLLQQLDPVDLCSAACVSRTWHAVALQEWPHRLDRWQHWHNQEWAGMRKNPALAHALYQLRHQVDCDAVDLILDMQWPEKASMALCQFRRWGGDVLDVLTAMAKSQGLACLSTRHWAMQALTAVKAQCAADQLRSMAHQADSFAAIEEGAVSIAAVHHPARDVHAEVSQALCMLTQEAQRRLLQAAADKSMASQRTSCSGCCFTPANTTSATPDMGLSRAGSGVPAGLDLWRMGSSTMGSRRISFTHQLSPLTATEALAVINQLLFGDAPPPHQDDEPTAQDSPADDNDQEAPDQQSAASGASPGLPAGRSQHAGDFWMDSATDQPLLIPPPEGYGLGLQGNKDDFYQPSNSLLPDVFTTRLGIPISLAVIHSAVCRAVGLKVELLNMPLRIISRMSAGGVMDLHSPPPSTPTQHVQHTSAHATVFSTSPSQTEPAPEHLLDDQGSYMALSEGGCEDAHQATSPSRAAQPMHVADARDVLSEAAGTGDAQGGLQVLPAEQDVYIDLFSGGKLMDDTQLRSFMWELGIESPAQLNLTALSRQGVVARMCANLIDIYHARRQHDKLHVMLQLATAVSPGARDLWAQRMHAALAVRDFTDAQVCVEGIKMAVLPGLDDPVKRRGVEHQMESLTRHCVELEEEWVGINSVVKTRSGNPAAESLKFGVGDVIYHTQYGYRGVIFNWDPTCAAVEDWMQQMGVDALPGGRHQPFYWVLVDVRDRTSQTTYVAQCNLQLLADHDKLQDEERQEEQEGAADAHHPETPAYPTIGHFKPDEDAQQAAGMLAAPVLHPDLGVHFQDYDAASKQFLPNDITRHRFPDDPACTKPAHSRAEWKKRFCAFLSQAGASAGQLSC